MKMNVLQCGILAAGLLVGCSTSGQKVDPAQLNTIKVGDDKAAVQARIGAPDQVSSSITGGETWTYAYSKSRPNAKRFIPLFGTFIGGKNTETQTVTVYFDDSGRVADVMTAYGGNDAKGRPITTTTGNASSSTSTTTTTTVNTP